MRAVRTVRSRTGVWVAGGLTAVLLAGLLGATGSASAASSADPVLPGAGSRADVADPDVVVEPVVEQPATATRIPRAALAAPVAESLSLHSRPGSLRTIYLDFDGEVVTGTEWNRSSGLPTGGYRAEPWSLDSDLSFSTTELARIQSVWAMVTEDFAPFDVDVTTEDPGNAKIDRSGAADTEFGTRVVLTDSDAWREICGGPCGGAAFRDVFDQTSSHAFYQPAWVFPELLGEDDVKIMADAASHEVGHTFGLDHDATTSSPGGYDTGGAGWGPIMGAPYYEPLTQWSRGEYAGADNVEDDVALIARGGAPLRADDAGNTMPTATVGLPPDGGVISTRSDIDLYRLSACTGNLSIRADTAPISPDLDIALRVLDASGREVAADNPPMTKVSGTRSTGLDASVTIPGSSGDYFVSVDGAASGDSTKGSDYGSLGQYTVALTGSCATPAGAPGGVRAALDGTSATISWTAPAASSSSITGYRVTASPGGASVTTSATSATLAGLVRGTSYTFSVVATNAGGHGPAATTTLVVPATTPGAVGSLSTSGGSSSVMMWWTPPVSDGGSTITGYRVQMSSSDQVVPAGVESFTVTGVQSGTYTATITPLNAVGGGAATAQAVSVTGPAAGAQGAVGLFAKIRPSTSGSPRVGSRLRVRPGSWSRPVTVRYAWLVAGRSTGARGTTYRPTTKLVGKKLSMRVTVSAPGSPSVVVTLRVGKVRR